MIIDSTSFDFTKRLEAEWEKIRDEYFSLPANSFEPWVQREMYGDGWSVYGLYAFGKQIPQACNQCPRTATILETVPGLTMAGFSLMAPNTHIKPHVGWVSTVYRLHLGLIVPPDCGLRVGRETREWKEGSCLIFDDTVEHEAWNNSDRIRTVLLLDFLRPGVEAGTIDKMPDDVQGFASQYLKKH